MRRLTVEDTERLLAEIQMKIGKWGQLCDINGRPYDASEWLRRAAPTEALALYSVSHQIIRLLELRTWVVLQMDYSTNFSEDEDFLISRLMCGPQERGVLIQSRSFLFELDGSDAPRERWLLGDVLHALLLFGSHCQVVSGNSVDGEHLSVQDGYVYFLSRDSEHLIKAAQVLKQIEETPLASPSG
jgi:hypothetical protein